MQKPSLREMLAAAFIGSIRANPTQPGAAAPVPTGSPSRSGCGVIIVVLIVLGLLALALERIGCVATDDAIRQGTLVSVVGTEVKEGKGLFIVDYRVKNEARWPVSLRIEWYVRKTTGEEVDTNEVSFEKISPHQELQERVMFDLGRLKSAGIKDPKDPDLCQVAFRIIMVHEADK